ncbi:hypothetical protein lerEdw1_020709, partial [Lerista edwardsae]
VFGAFLPAPQLLEAIQLLAALPESFSWLDGFALMQELLDQYLHKTLRARLSSPRNGVGRDREISGAPASTPHRSPDYQEHWGVLLSSVRHTEIFQQLAAWMPSVTGLGKCAVQVLHHCLSAGTASKEVLRELFPQLSVALLGQICACGGEHQALIRSLGWG